MSTIKPLARKNDIVLQEFDEEFLLYDLKLNKAFALNSTSSRVWQNCDGKNTVSEIADKLSVELKELVSEDLVWLTLEKLKKEKLIDDNSDFVSPFDTISRREVIRRVGVGSLVALPVIASLIAPSAIYAASCADSNNNLNLNIPGCACMGADDCTSNCCGFGTICAVVASVANGGPCRVNCECISNMCVDPPGPTLGTCQP